MFKKFSELILERFDNVFTPQEKQPYVDIVWDLLQSAYKSQGGIHGSGFANKEDMINKIPFWKIGKINGNVVCVSLYKDSSGRKRIAVASNGTEEGKQKLLEIMIEDIKLGRCYVELSGRSLSFINKHFDVSKVAVPLNQVEQKLKKHIEPLNHEDDNTEEVKRFPKLTNFFYKRKIGSEQHIKIMLGNINAESLNLN